MLFATIESSGQQQDAFRYLDERRTSLDKDQQRIFQNIKRQPATISAHLIRFNNLDVLKESQSLRFSLPNLTVITATKKKAEMIRADCWVWSGSFEGDKGSVFLSATGIDIYGVIHFERLLFTIEPLGKGLHALVQHDPSKFPPDEPPDWNPTPQKQYPNGNQEVQNNSMESVTTASTIDTIDVLVVYTPAAAQSSGNIMSLVDGCINITNKGFENSDVNV